MYKSVDYYSIQQNVTSIVNSALRFYSKNTGHNFSLSILILSFFTIISFNGLSAQGNINKIEKVREKADSVHAEVDSLTGLPYMETDCNFATDWVSIGGMSEQEQINQIENKTAQYYLSLKQGEDFLNDSLKSIDEITSLNKRWQSIKKEQSANWLNNLLEKEKILNDSYREMIKAVQDTQKIQLDIESNIQERKKIQNKINSLNIREQEIIALREKNKNNLKSRLKNLSLGSLLIAQVQKEYSINTISNKMINLALSDINGVEINTYQVTEDQNIRELIVKKNEGYAQIIDTYFKPIVLISRNTVKTNFKEFHIRHIEVFPFNKQIPSFNKSNSNMKYPDDIKIFTVKNDSAIILPRNEIKNKNLTSKSLSSFGFNTDVLNYIRTQYDIVRSSERTIKNEIENYKAEFFKKDRTYKNDLNEVCNQITMLNVNKSKLETENKNNRNNLFNKRMEINIKKENYNNYKIDYESFYKNKNSIINKIIYSEIERLSSLKSETIKEMAKETYSIVKNIKESNIKDIVMLEQTESKSFYNRLTGKPIEYYAEVDSFRILYLTVHTEDTESGASILLNIGYKLKWSTEPYIVIDSKNKIITDCRNDNEWKVFNTSSVSARLPGNSTQPGGWRLPSFTELADFSMIITKFMENKPFHPFIKLDWPVNKPYISDPTKSEDYFMDEENFRLFRCYNFNQFNKIDLFPEEVGYLIYVRPLAK